MKEPSYTFKFPPPTAPILKHAEALRIAVLKAIKRKKRALLKK